MYTRFPWYPTDKVQYFENVIKYKYMYTVHVMHSSITVLKYMYMYMQGQPSAYKYLPKGITDMFVRV